MIKLLASSTIPVIRVVVFAALLQNVWGPSTLWAQGDDSAEDSQSRVNAETQSSTENAGNQDELANPTPDSPSVLSLFVKGGWLMLPIVGMSILVVALAIERSIALRRSRILPDELVASMGKVLGREAPFEPKQVFRLAQQYPSSASRVLTAMLQKLGRPHQELEHTVSETCQREANRLFRNVRTLHLAAGVTPLLGLLGTVWGMIQAFFVTANMPGGANKAEALAEGIYVALVTTFAGLAVAIPAAVLAHIFEGRIESMLQRVEEFVASILPQVERFEGNRVLDGEVGSDMESGRTAPPVTRSPVATK